MVAASVPGGYLGRQIDLWSGRNCDLPTQPCAAEPGSEEKIQILAERYQRARRSGSLASLHHPDDEKGRPGWGWRITKGRNGRIIAKVAVPLDQANAAEIAAEETRGLIEEMRLGSCRRASR